METTGQKHVGFPGFGCEYTRFVKLNDTDSECFSFLFDAFHVQIVCEDLHIRFCEPAVKGRRFSFGVFHFRLRLFIVFLVVQSFNGKDFLFFCALKVYIERYLSKIRETNTYWRKV